ncbi:MAG: SUMF1/EgtB/PvdO family nonheme iron enzyme [Anaerolineae bacterium]|nr:SUMF1/EgtB/PvdO family nonheme iron enzyme [Anaerolineae bacterium]MBT7325400.1 SUMF1/EgtB/PvdO family nonheme iron enzyme [Anaerolineae bacterium]
MEIGSKFLYADGSVLVAVPAGDFIMGGSSNDNPEHTVFLGDYWIYRTPVTNRQYSLCVEAGLCELPNMGDNLVYEDPLRVNDPVVGVDWEQGAAFCSFMNARLPTEAEWEKAARGPDGNTFPWGEDVASCNLLNAADCVGTTTDVTDYQQGMSYYEVFDMAGNVYEWVADWYSPTYYGKSPAENPFGPEAGDKRSIRSSSFSSAFYATEVARRFSAKPVDHRRDLGFRCVVNEPTHFAPYCEKVVVYGMDANYLDPLSNPDITNTCPSFSISQAMYCENKTPLTNVTFNVIPPSILAMINSGSCTLLSGSTYICTAPDPISICAECTQAINVDPQCPPGYHLTGLKCIPDQPFPGECIPGVNYDPENMCCDAQPGGLPDSGNAILKFCQTGTYYFNPPGGCFAIPGTGTVCKNDTVTLKTCGGGGDPGGCQPPPGGCTWDANRCCCMDVTGACIP